MQKFLGPDQEKNEEPVFKIAQADEEQEVNDTQR